MMIIKIKKLNIQLIRLILCIGLGRHTSVVFKKVERD